MAPFRVGAKRLSKPCREPDLVVAEHTHITECEHDGGTTRQAKLLASRIGKLWIPQRGRNWNAGMKRCCGCQCRPRVPLGRRKHLLSKHCVFRDQQSPNYHSRSASNPTQPGQNALTTCCPWQQRSWFSPFHPRPSSAIPYPYTPHCGGRFCFHILIFLPIALSASFALSILLRHPFPFLHLAP